MTQPYFKTLQTGVDVADEVALSFTAMTSRR